MSSNLSPNLILKAYASGIFPMSESRDDEGLFWVNPEKRGIIPLDGFHMSRSLRRTIRSEPFQIRVDTDFAGTIEGCADRAETWINDEIFSIYMELFDAGHAHSLEVWDGDELVGGVYGVALQAAFFGESMFSRRRDASKIALAYLVSRLNAGGFELFDTQFLTDHLASMGGIEISRRDYQDKLRDALEGAGNFHLQPLTVSGQQICSE
ncbi:MAG: leucyl/phenylalanyl-tRNA--protein transferase [Paracoccaceae bacterium]